MCDFQGETRGQRTAFLLSHVGPRDEALIIRLRVKKPETTSLLTGPGLSAFLSHARSLSHLMR